MREVAMKTVATIVGPGNPSSNVKSATAVYELRPRGAAAGR
jgi:hypothetical protein